MHRTGVRSVGPDGMSRDPAPSGVPETCQRTTPYHCEVRTSDSVDRGCDTDTHTNPKGCPWFRVVRRFEWAPGGIRPLRTTAHCEITDAPPTSEWPGV